MWDLKVCRACLATDVKLYHIQRHNFQMSYESLSGLKLSGVDGMPLNVCVECATLLKKYTAFRKKCRRAYFSLKEILDAKLELTEDYVKEVDRSEVNLTSLIAPCALPQTVVKISNNKRFTIKDSSMPILRLYNITSVEISPKSDSPRAKGKRVKHETEMSVEVEETTKEETTETVAESSQISISIENGEIIVVPSVVEESLKVEDADDDYNDKFGSEDNSFDDDDFDSTVEQKFTEELKYSPESDEEKTKVSIKRTKHRTKVKSQEPVAESSVKRLRSGKRKLDDNTAKTKQDKKHTRSKLLKEKEYFAHVTFLTQEEQKAEVEKRKESSNYLYARYKCELCYKGFMEENTYKNHQLRHNEKVSGRFECDFCHARFKQLVRLNNHITANHMRRFTCKLCTYTCSNRTQAITHHRWHNGVTYTCKHCGEVSSKISSHLSHVRIKHPSRYICSTCANTFVSEAGLVIHRRMAHQDNSGAKGLADQHEVKDKETYCTECSMQFDTAQAYTKHVLISPNHHAGNDYINGCRNCGEMFESREQLKQHAVTHSRHHKPGHAPEMLLQWPTPCPQCNEMLYSRSLYRNHMQSAHPVFRRSSLKKFICEWCGKSYPSNAALSYHIRMHTGEKPYKCQICPKEFHHKLNFDNHLRAHSDVRPFPCPTCGKAFKLKPALERHMFGHTGLKPYKCNLCNKAYNQKSTVKMHVRAVHYKEPWPVSRKRREQRRSVQPERCSQD